MLVYHYIKYYFHISVFSYCVEHVYPFCVKIKCVLLLPKINSNSDTGVVVNL